jgi:Flp pilus assembly protein CpaB
MATQMRQPRTRSGGGRTLMLLGVLLALAAGTIVIYVVSQATGSGAHTVTVVVASQNVPTGKILSATTSDDTHLLISSVFTTKQVNADFVPQDVYTYTDMSHLNIALQDEVVVGQFYAGDILRASDPRLVAAGQAALGSQTLLNPSQLPKGDVLYPLKVDNLEALGLVAGDHVDMIIVSCASSGTASIAASSCPAGSQEAQTTMQNIYVYSVRSGLVYVVLSHQDALTLTLINTDATITLVIRSPGDSDPANTFPVTGSYIYQHFHFTQP